MIIETAREFDPRRGLFSNILVANLTSLGLVILVEESSKWQLVLWDVAIAPGDSRATVGAETDVLHFQT